MGKVAEIFDLCGLAAPITAGLKIDLHDLVVSSYDWDDKLSFNDRENWLQNFALMESLGSCVWPRVIIPIDAVDLHMEIIGSGDASQKIACAAIYVRFLKKDGSYSCQLVLSKTKIIPVGLTLPPAELLGSTLNTQKLSNDHFSQDSPSIASTS